MRLVRSALWIALVAGVVVGCGGDGDTTTIIEQGPTTEATPETPAPLDEKAEITTQGLGPVLAGMTRDEVEAAGNVQLTFESGMAPACSYATTAAIADVSFMFVHGELARVDIRNPNVATESGIRPGATEQEVLDAYGDQIEREPNAYVPKGSYLKFVPEADTDPTRIVFETDGRKVTYIRAGRLPEVDYIEGCS